MTSPKKGFRLDVQGMRAIAVGLVLLYHAGVPFMTGGFVGVDVFFVISGFLITGLLLKEVRSHGSISISGFYVRRIKRILPAAILVLVVTAAITLAILPPSRWESIAWHIFAAMFSVVNWSLASSSINYLNSGAAASPIQHYWSLAVEEQFYVLWPLLLIAAVFLARPIRTKFFDRGPTNYPRFKSYALALAVLIFMFSLGYSAFLTSYSPGAAYFVTTTRAWELAIGAILAILADRMSNIPIFLKTIWGWAGLAAILYSGVAFDAATAFPGTSALIPTVGAALIIASGLGRTSALGVGTLLSTRPFVWIGDISYSLYLWHWPLLILASYLATDLSTGFRLLVVLAAILPAYLSLRYVETPIHTAKTPPVNYTRVIGDGVLGMLAGALVPVLMLSFWVTPVPPVISASVVETGDQEDSYWSSPETEEAANPVGAALLQSDPGAAAPQDEPGPYQPTALSAPNDNPSVYSQGCHAKFEETDAKSCIYGDEDSDFVVAVAGDSHAAHWIPALRELAAEKDWRLETYTKSSCPLADVDIYNDSNETIYENCSTWNRNVQTKLAQAEPDLVITSSLFHAPVVDGQRVDGAEHRLEVFSSALARSWQELIDGGAKVVAIADTPNMDIDVPECASANPETMTKCSADRAVALEYDGLVERAAAESASGATVANLNEFVCPGQACQPVIGGVMVYRDSTHLTATYSRSLAPALGKKLDAVIEQK